MLVAALFLGAATLSAQLTPYEYAKRWYVSLQGGMVYFNGDWTYVFREYPGEWLTPAMPAFGASVGYGIANGHELRLTASYGKKKASCISYDYKLYPYSFHSVSLVADYVLAFMAYNAGLGNVQKWMKEGTIQSNGSDIENIPFKETNLYVRKIIHHYEIYQELYSQK